MLPISKENIDQQLKSFVFFNSNLRTAIEIFRSYIENVHIKSFETMRQVCFFDLLNR